jgi:hypothetical protein
MKDKIKRLYWKVAVTRLDGVGVVEIILILVIIIGLVLIFRNQIVQIISNAFASINENSGSVSADITLAPTK